MCLALCKSVYFFLTFSNCGAEILTFPGIFLARTSSFTDFMRSFSRLVHDLSLRKIATPVLAALPRLLVPGISFTLNLKIKEIDKNQLNIHKSLILTCNFARLDMAQSREWRKEVRPHRREDQ